MDNSKIRIKEHFGLITNDTNTRQFSFLISPPKSRPPPQQKDYIVIDHPIYGDSSQIIAKIIEISSYEEVAGSTINDRLGKMLATAHIIGFVNSQNDLVPLQKLELPPNPGGRIYMPYKSFLEDIFSRNQKGARYEEPLCIGKEENKALTPEWEHLQLDYNLNADYIVGMHTLIAAVNGAGKTTTTKTLLYELCQKTTIPIVIIDPNGEYTDLQAGTYTTSVHSAVKEIPKPKPSHITIITGQSQTLKEKNENLAQALTAMSKARVEKTTPQFLLIIEDAENLMGQLQEIVTVKTGITTILITSRPTDLGPKILAQMGNQIIGKTADPTDIAYLKAILNCTEQEITILNQGEFIVDSLNKPQPTKVQIKNSN
jgi:DNA helicase HerA-like ATPase